MTSSPPLTPPPTPTTTSPPRDEVVDTLRRRADNPSAFLALNAGTQHFTTPGIDGVIAYRRAGRRTIVQLGGVFADPADQPRLLAAFLAHATQLRRRVVAVQLLR